MNKTNNKEQLVVGFLSSSDYQDRRKWSGIRYFMFRALEKEFSNVIPIGPVKTPLALKALLYALNVTHLVLFGKKYNRHHNNILSKYFAYCFNKELSRKKVDVIIAPACSVEIAHLNTSIPICYLSDTSFKQVNNYYDEFSQFSDSSTHESIMIEQKAIDNSTSQVYPSEWASNFVIENYNADKKNVFNVKFGANLDIEPERSDVISREYTSPYKLIFISVDWERKGGNLVLDTLKLLLQRGFDVSLTVCGCVPPVKHPNMNVIPFLNKNKPDDREKFYDLLLDSHILLLPSLAECFGIVICEANAFGLPAITSNTGGIPSAVTNGINGYTIPEFSPELYADKIQSLIENPEKLKSLGISSRNMYENELNWGVWANKMRDILKYTAEKS